MIQCFNRHVESTSPAEELSSESAKRSPRQNLRLGREAFMARRPCRSISGKDDFASGIVRAAASD